jgi:3',5'-cyclic AMP phosphodiesterase CpdA
VRNGFCGHSPALVRSPFVIRLFHLSDVHFGAEDPAALNWFVRLVAGERPDAVVMTGDLTMRARTREFEAGGEWLRGLGVPVTLEVGNHDLPYYYDIWRRFFRPYRRYRRIERLIERPLDLPGVTIVPLKTTARAQLRFDWSKGFVSDQALEQSLALIAAAPRGNTILIAAHHPLVEAGPSETAGTRHGARALAALAKAGAAAVLTGHIHEPYDVAYDCGGRTIRLIGAGTISRRVRHSPAAFNELRIARGAIETIVRTMSSTPDEKLAFAAA